MSYLKDELYALVKKDDFIFDFIQESALDGLWYWDLTNPKEEWMNPRFWKTLGYDPATMPHKVSAWQDIINKDDLETVQIAIANHFADPTFPYDTVVRYRHAAGHSIWIRCKGMAIRDEAGKPIRMLGAHIDITAEKENEQRLKDRVERYDHIFKGTDLGTWEWDMVNKVSTFNERWANMVGYTLAELEPLSDNSWSRLVHPDDLILANNAVDDYLHGKKDIYECEVRMRHKQGHWIWVSVNARVVSHTSDGQPALMTGFHLDITRRKESELLAAHYQDLLNKTNAAGRIGQWELDVCKDLLFLSEVTKEILDVGDNDDFHFNDILQFIKQGETPSEVLLLFEQAMDKGDGFDALTHLKTRSGKEVWVRIIAQTEQMENSCSRMFGLIMDVDETTRANKQLALQEQQFRQTFEFAAIGMAQIRINGAWMKVNKSLCEFLGYSSDELEKRRYEDFVHPEDWSTEKVLFQELVDNKHDYLRLKTRYLHRNGQLLWGMVSISIVRNEHNDPLYFVVQINNISEEIRANAQLNESLTKMNAILDATTQVSIIETDLSGIIWSFNKGAENLLGYSGDDIIGKSTPLLFHDEQEVQHRSNQLSDVNSLPIVGFEVLVQSAKQGIPETREWTYVKRDGGTLPVLLSVTNIKNAHGETTGFLSVAIETTKIKQAEAEIKSLYDVTQEQNERLLSFAHIVSHNLRSHTGNLTMILDLMSEHVPSAAENEFFPMIQAACDNLSETVKHLSDVVVSNTSAENLVSLNLNDYVEHAIATLKGLKMSFEFSVENRVDDQIAVLAVPAYLDSIVLNLLTNAVKYRSPHRNLMVSIEAEVSDQWVVFKVTDNGLGIDLKYHGSKIFGMFKTFHGNADARGVGLFITKNQTVSMGGKIEVDSEIDKGSVFSVYLKHDKN